MRAFIAAVAGAVLAPAAWACSSCGCSLSTDWGAQGYTSGEGLTMDLRYDYFNQDQLRSGIHEVNRSSFTYPNDREVQRDTGNRNTTLTLDYSPSHDWGVTFLLPYFNRDHSTIAEGDTEISSSHTRSIGDVRVIGHYQGFEGGHSNYGVQAGLKLPTGKFNDDFSKGPQEGEPIDRGLQPGTGTTDLLVGVFYYDAFSRDWDYFAQAMIQQPLNSRDEFRPGTGFNASVGVRYVGFESFSPHLQINTRIENREQGANADKENSGATLVYLSPGVTVPVSKSLSVYGFGQVPIYQRVNGLQIESDYSVSVGIRYAM